MFLGWTAEDSDDESYLDVDDGTQLSFKQLDAHLGMKHYLVGMDDVKAVKAYLEELLDRELGIPMPASLALLSCPTGTCVVCKQLPCTSINSRTTRPFRQCLPGHPAELSRAGL